MGKEATDIEIKDKEGKKIGRYVLHRHWTEKQNPPEVPKKYRAAVNLSKMILANAELNIFDANDKWLAELHIRYNNDIPSDEHWAMPISAITFVNSKLPIGELPRFGIIATNNLVMDSALVGTLARCVIDNQSKTPRELFDITAQKIRELDRSQGQGFGSAAR